MENLFGNSAISNQITRLIVGSGNKLYSSDRYLNYDLKTIKNNIA